jgi:predicted RNA binding protein YcfA (HicA-like mRNA interferase family)
LGTGFYPQVRKALRAGGCVFHRQAKGSHEIWITPNGQKITVPVTVNKRATANAILKQAGISGKI